jgi:aromatic ring-opening dioxygenase LigB subunit
MKDAATVFASVAPELIVFCTPHGFQLESDFALYTSANASGTAEWEGEFKEFAATVNLDSALTQALLPKLRAAGIHAQGVSCYFGPGRGTCALRWGEVVPLWFLDRADDLKSKKFIFISLPSRRYDDVHGTAKEAELLGECLEEWLAALPMRTAVVISGDLAHTHQPSAAYTFSYQTHPSAQVFDSHIRRWAEDPMRNEDALCVQAAACVSDALSCGFVGMRLLNKLLRKWNEKQKFTSRAHHYGAPTYYGMIVVSILAQK